MNTGEIRTKGQISSYKVKEVNINDEVIVGQYLDAKSMYTVFPKMNNSLKVQEILDKANDEVPNILGEKSELFTLFNQRIIRQNTKAASDIKVYVELPQQENYIEIKKVHVASDVTSVGRQQKTWQMTVGSANLTSRNFYQLVDYPEIQFRVTDEGIPDGTLGYKYSFQVMGGYNDYIKVAKLHTSARFLNLGAPMGEAAVKRGSVEMTVGGKAYVCYRYGYSRMGFETYVTDEAWRLGTHFAMYDEKKMKEDPEYKIPFMFSEWDGKFKMEVEKVYDRYMMTGKGFPAGESFMVDRTTHRPVKLGPTFMDYFRAANKEFYYVSTFNIEMLLDRVRRQIHKMKIKDRSGLMVDIITGDGGWTLLTPELNRLNTQGVVEPEWLYTRTEGLDKNRQGVILNKMQVRGIHLDDYGTVVFHNNDILNKGILSGPREVRGGFTLSSYWFIIMISHNNEIQKNPANKAIYLYENKDMEQYTPLAGTWTPTGPIGSVSTNYKSAGDIGNMYKIIYELEKGLYAPNIQGLQILFSDLVIND